MRMVILCPTLGALHQELGLWFLDVPGSPCVCRHVHPCAGVFSGPSVTAGSRADLQGLLVSVCWWDLPGPEGRRLGCHSPLC